MRNSIQRYRRGRSLSCRRTTRPLHARPHRVADVAQPALDARQREARKLATIGALAGGIAHDFNNILGAVLGYGELARSAAAAHSELARHLDGVLLAGQRAKALVGRILSFGRAGTAAAAPVNVQSIVAEAIDLLRPTLSPAIDVTCELQTGSAAVIGDATQIHQVIANLCSNAVQAMPEGGTLGVSLALRRSSEPLRLVSGALPAGSYLCLAVRDDGHGIEPVVLHRIFEPFFSTKGSGGTGLGLSLVHGIVSELGGGIDVATAPGAGACFSVWLPWSGHTAAAGTSDAVLPRGSGQRILLVEDEVALLHVVEEMLAALGYEAAVHGSSAAALKAFAAEPDRFDAVVTGETMPQMSGSQMALHMRRIRPDIPIVLMSGRVASPIDTPSGIDVVLPKPLGSRDIAATLARALAT